MAQPQPPNRQVTLDLSQLQKYPTKSHVIAMTLPFKAEDVYPSFRKDVIKRTKKRWAWFSDARKKDDRLGTSLGTLGYLPWEVRRFIFEIVLRGYFEECKHPLEWSERYRCLWYLNRYNYIHEAIDKWDWQVDYERRVNTPGVPDVFELDSYQPSNPNAPTMNVRLASQSLRTEFEHHFLRDSNFSFDCPRALEEFLGQLTCHQKAQLRHFYFELWNCCGCCTAQESDGGWISMASQLPPFLKSLRIEIECNRGLPGINAFGVHRGPAELKQLNRAATFLEIMSKMAARSAPRLTTSMVKGDTRYTGMLQEDNDLLDAAVADVEHC